MSMDFKEPSLSELLDERTTQVEFARIVGMSEARVSELVSSGVLVRGETAHEWIMAYCAHLREVAAGRAAAGGLDLAAERARLAAEQADRIAMQNAKTRGELAPVYLIEHVLSNTAAKIGGILDALPGLIRRRLQQLTSEDIDAIRLEVAKARNAVASMSLAELLAEERREGADEEGEDTQPGAAIDEVAG